MNACQQGAVAAEAAAPAVLEVPGKGRVLVFAWGMESSGVPSEWAAGANRPGVNFLPDLSGRSLEGIMRQVQAASRGAIWLWPPSTGAATGDLP